MTRKMKKTKMGKTKASSELDEINKINELLLSKNV